MPTGQGSGMTDSDEFPTRPLAHLRTELPAQKLLSHVIAVWQCVRDLEEAVVRSGFCGNREVRGELWTARRALERAGTAMRDQIRAALAFGHTVAPSAPGVPTPAGSAESESPVARAETAGDPDALRCAQCGGPMTSTVVALLIPGAGDVAAPIAAAIACCLDAARTGCMPRVIGPADAPPDDATPAEST
jgi:hypothetical protein